MKNNLDISTFSAMQPWEIALIALSFLIGYRLASRLLGVARAIVIFQLMLVMVVGVVMSLQSGVKLTHPVESVLSVCLGGLVGAGRKSTLFHFAALAVETMPDFWLKIHLTWFNFWGAGQSHANFKYPRH